MDENTSKLGDGTGSFALAAAITILFNTALACVKDAYKPLALLMTSFSGSDWTTQGVADVILFIGIGLIVWKTNLAKNVRPSHMIRFLAVATITAGVALFIWYASH